MAEAAPHNPVAKLAAELDSSGMPLELWGVGNAKTVEDLQKELDQGEVSLIIGDNGELTRQVRALAVNIYYPQTEDRWLKLIEASQQFSDGRRRRIRRHNTSIGEKLLRTEEPGEEVLMRALDEELGVKPNGVTAWEHIKDVEQRRESASYPGLTTNYLLHHYWVELNDQGYNAEGYVEFQPDKTTRFVWVFTDVDGKILLN